MDEQLEFLRLIVARLESAGIRYMVTGSVAMAIYSVPRMTRDIDLVVECRPEDAERIAKLFEADCYVDLETIRKAVAGRAMFNIIHSEWVIKADFITRKDEPYRRLEFERRRRAVVGDLTVTVVAPEDLILSKLCWATESDSALQQRDARWLIGSVPNLDVPYLETWAQRLGVGSLLDRARSA